MQAPLQLEGSRRGGALSRMSRRGGGRMLAAPPLSSPLSSPSSSAGTPSPFAPIPPPPPSSSSLSSQQLQPQRGTLGQKRSLANQGQAAGNKQLNASAELAQATSPQPGSSQGGSQDGLPPLQLLQSADAAALQKRPRPVTCSCGHTHMCSSHSPVHSSSGVALAENPDDPSRTASRSWRKILYEPQPFPDNHTGDEFLATLVTNGNVSHWSVWSTMLESAGITQRISIVMLLVLVFVHLLAAADRGAEARREASMWLLFLALVLTLVGSSLQHHIASGSAYFSRARFHRFVQNSLLKMLLFSGALLGLSPVLMTLTSSYSSDTIWALTFSLFLIHIVFHDYTKRDPVEASTFQSTLSLNAAIFASVLLASRLNSAEPVFAFMLFAFCLFAGFPVVAVHVRHYSGKCHLLVTFTLVTLVLEALSLNQSKLVTFVYLFSVVFVTFVCPVWLKWIHRYKRQLQGPWDYDTEKEIEGDNFKGA